MNDFNIDENTINKLKNMMDNGELSDIISKIPPEMVKNFSSAMNNENASSFMNGDSSSFNINADKSSSADNSSASGNFDFNNIDVNTIIKMKSIIDKINSKDDPRSNLLRSLKPYLRDERREKVDQYANLMNVAKIAELFKNDSKENNK